MYGLCDCNNFFVSCERVFNPALNGKPVVVLSNNDGCIIARSNEAKALGLKMAEPLFKVKSTIERGNVKVFSSNYQLYGDMSNRVMITLKQLVEDIEIYSIDEAFLNFGNSKNLETIGADIVKTVSRNTGIPVSLGIAPTKTLAKVASRLCKKYPKLNGCCIMYREEDIKKVLSKLDISDIWGIGRRHTKMLNENFIYTAIEFYNMSENWVKARMGITGVRTWLELHSIEAIEFNQTVSNKQSITVSRTFANEVTDIKAMSEAISTFISMGGEKLRKQNSLAGRLDLYITTNRHNSETPQYSQIDSVIFDTPTDSTLVLVKAASTLLNKIYRNGYNYKKGGIMLHNIVDNSNLQLNIFNPIDIAKHKAIMSAVDTLNSQHGNGAVKLASASLVENLMNRNHLSKCYTTKWEDIIEIKAN